MIAINGSAANNFVNSRPIVKINGFGYTNEPEGDPQYRGIFKGKTTYTVVLHNYGTAVAQTTTYTRDATSSLISTMTDALGRQTAFTYNSLGQVLCSHSPGGPATARPWKCRSARLRNAARV